MKKLFILFGLLAMLTACADGELEYTPADEPIPDITDPKPVPTNIKPISPQVLAFIKECPNAIACNPGFQTLLNHPEILDNLEEDEKDDPKDDDEYVNVVTGSAFVNMVILTP